MASWLLKGRIQNGILYDNVRHDYLSGQRFDPIVCHERNDENEAKDENKAGGSVAPSIALTFPIAGIPPCGTDRHACPNPPRVAEGCAGNVVFR